ncbi:MAG: hypothetical protein ACI4UM_01235 [Succinivibrio sp.]
MYTSKATWAYYAHFKKAIKRDHTLADHAKDSVRTLMELPPRIEAKINSIFNVLFHDAPCELSYWIKTAALVENDIFCNYNDFQESYIMSKADIYKLSESPILFLSRLTNYPVSLLIDEMNQASTSLRHFIGRLTNQGTPYLLKTLEHVLQIKSKSVNPDMFSLKSESKKKFISYKLASVGCSKNLNKNITNLHYRTLSEFYGKDNIKKQPRRKMLSPSKLILDKDFLSFTMLMLSIYTICCRIMTNHKPSSNHLQNRGVPKKLSVLLSVGVYKTCRYINDFLGKHEFKNSRETKSMFFPKFDDFYTILKLYVTGYAEPVACSHCDTPYLDVRDPNRSDEYMTSMPCPCCNRHAEYEVNDPADDSMQAD